MDEIELKVLDIDLDSVLAKLEKLGAKKIFEGLLVEKAFFGNNINPKQQLLRLRKEGNEVKLTYKQRKGTGDFLEAEEHELGVSDFDVMQKIIEKLGYTCEHCREKKRITFLLGKVHIEIDKYPTIPHYLEIEGNKEDILETLDKLGFTMKQTCTLITPEVLEHYGKDPFNQKF